MPSSVSLVNVHQYIYREYNNRLTNAHAWGAPPPPPRSIFIVESGGYAATRFSQVPRPLGWTLYLPVQGPLVSDYIENEMITEEAFVIILCYDKHFFCYDENSFFVHIFSIDGVTILSVLSDAQIGKYT